MISLSLKKRKIVLILSFAYFISFACNLRGDVSSVNDQGPKIPTQIVINPTVKATDPKPPESNFVPSDTPSVNQNSSNETTQPVVGEIKVIGGWYGPACDEAEGTYYYRWSVDLMENAASGGYIGVAKFHNCPDGGRVSYYLIGDPQTGDVINLFGEKTVSGGGDLFGSSDQTINFTFDLTTGKITPNLAP